MPQRPLVRATLVVVCLLLLAAAAPTADAGSAFLSKSGASGQVYLWTAGSC